MTPAAGAAACERLAVAYRLWAMPSSPPHSSTADRELRMPSHTIPTEMNRAAAPSSHHQPIPIPSTPTIDATVVVQSAFAMSASV